MADNAIDKLIEETRAAYTALEVVEKELVDADRAKAAARLRYNDAKKRCDTLDLTMKKHIHEDMPVIQAKMIAHEEIEQIRAADRSFAINANTLWPSGGSTIASSQSPAAANCAASRQSASAQAAINAQLANITKWCAGRYNGSLNLSI